MASSANHFSLFILLTLLSSLQIQARDNQFFNKVSNKNNNNNNVVPINNEPQNNQQPQEEPNFLPQNENTYGLYSHDSGHLPPSATTVKGGSPTAAAPSKRYLPKNYNPVAYVTEPEDINETESFTEESFNSNPENNNNYYNGEKNYYNQQQEEDSEFRRFRRPATTNNGNMYYNGGSSFNSDPQGFTGARFRGGAAAATDREKYSNNGGYEPQGMSDTRFMENGKYFYDVNNEKFSSNHPYQRLKSTRARNEYNNRNYYEQNSMEGYQNSQEFQDEENYNLP